MQEKQSKSCSIQLVIRKSIKKININSIPIHVTQQLHAITSWNGNYSLDKCMTILWITFSTDCVPLMQFDRLRMMELLLTTTVWKCPHVCLQYVFLSACLCWSASCRACSCKSRVLWVSPVKETKVALLMPFAWLVVTAKQGWALARNYSCTERRKWPVWWNFLTAKKKNYTISISVKT